MKKLFIVLILCIILQWDQAQKAETIIFFYKPYTDSSETNLYEKPIAKFNYNKQYFSIKNARVKQELDRAIKHHDYRFIAISGNSYIWPGLEGYMMIKGQKEYGILKSNERYINKYRFKVIMGTSDMEDSNTPPLQSVAADFAENYNKLLLEELRKIEKSTKSLNH